MSYQQQLKEHYKAVRERLHMGTKTVPVRMKTLALPPPSAECPDKTISAPSPEPVAKPGLLSESEEKKIVEQALNYTSLPRYKPFMGGRTRAQAERFEDELRLSPRLPPLEGVNLDEPGGIRWQRILHAVARRHGIRPEEIMGHSRRKELIKPRQEVYYRLRLELCFSYQKIAKIVNKDHTSVMHGVYKVRDQLLDEQNKKRNDGGPALVYHPASAGRTNPEPVGRVP